MTAWSKLDPARCKTGSEGTIFHSLNHTIMKALNWVAGFTRESKVNDEFDKKVMKINEAELHLRKTACQVPSRTTYYSTAAL